MNLNPKLPKYLIDAICCLLFMVFSTESRGQSGAFNPARRPQDWWQADLKTDSLPGISLNEAYKYLQGRKSKTVIVALLDECIDTAHEDLQGILWTNKKEIPGNGKDDDHNGYIDDVYGWCFVCGPNNTSQTVESSDEERTYVTWRKQFENIDTGSLSGSLKIQYEMYRESRKKILETYRLNNLARQVQADTIRFMNYLNGLLPAYKDSAIGMIHYTSIPFTNAYDSVANLFMQDFMYASRKYTDFIQIPFEKFLDRMKRLINMEYFF